MSGGARPPAAAASLGRVAKLLWAERGWYGFAALFVLVSIGTALAYPQVIRLIIDQGIQGGRVDRLNQLSLLMVGILLVEGVATYARDYGFNLAAERVAGRLRRIVFDALVAQDIQFFDRRDSGELTTRLSADVPVLQWVLGEELGDAVRHGVFGVCGTALLFYTSPRLTLLTLLAVPPIVAAASILGRRVKVLAAEVQAAHAQAGAAAQEIVAGVRTVRAFSQEAAERARYGGEIARALELARRKIVAKAALGGVSFVAGESAALLAIWVGGNLIATGRMTTGALISFILYALLVARGFRNTSRYVAESARAVGATGWMFDLLGRRPLIPLEGGDRPADLDGSIVFEQVRFRYPTRPEVDALKGIDIRIEPGEVVAVVGRSGAGKSTLLSLILRFYDPDEGRVLVGGRDVRELDPVWLRQHVASVLQEPTLFSRSIADNIRYGRAEAGDEAVELAAALACADEFIDRLPAAYRTTIGDRGVQLSGGQRQRLAIARAVLRRPKVLVLDEATSALDAELESLVRDSLRALDYRPTTIVIAHRLSTVTSVDRVLVLDHGRIVEAGGHDELVRASAFYRQLVQSQLVLQ